MNQTNQLTLPLWLKLQHWGILSPKNEFLVAKYKIPTKNSTVDLRHPVGFSSVEILYHRNFLDTVHGRKSSRLMASSHSRFSLFYHYNIQGSRLQTVIQPLVETTGLLISWVFSFLPRKIPTSRINKVGVSCQTTPMGTIIYIHSPRTGVDFSRHTHGSESSPIVQGLVQDLNVYKTHGAWLSQWNLTTTDAFKMQWVFSCYHDKQTNTHGYYIHGFNFSPTIT